MRSSELVRPLPMSRVAIVAPRRRLRDALVRVAETGAVELVGQLSPAEGEEAEALRRLERARPDTAAQPARLSTAAVDAAALEAAAERGLLAGEVELRRRATMAREHGRFAALVGWMPTRAVPALEERLEEVGAAVVVLPRPAWVEPPTHVESTPVRRHFRPLVTTYGVARYADIDPTLFAAASFVVMFGMMFGDVGHGLVLAALGLALRRVRHGRLAPFRSLWPFPVAAGLAATVFGLLYGEAFGPTGLVPRLWLDPIDHPGPLLVVALAIGALLLSVSHLYGIVNRWRESGPVAALVSQTGFAGLLALLGGLVAGLGWYAAEPVALYGGLAVVAAGGLLLGAGFLTAAGGGGTGLTQALVELVDALVRIASNLLSFTRLAAFGLMHAALGAIVWGASVALWGGVAGTVAAVVVFAVGNVVAFALELLVTGVQALRLEFYELFSRIFAGEGHPFLPWTIPVASAKEES